MSHVKSLVRGSLIVTLGTVFSGALSYLYSILVGRMLGPVKFGDLGAITSLILIVTSVGTAILTITMRYTSELYTKGDLAAVARFYRRFSQLTFYFSLALTLACLVLTPVFSQLFAINDRLALGVAVLSIVLSLLVIVNRGALQGVQRFPAMSLSLIAELTLKILVTFLLLRAGYSLVGVAVGLVITGVFSYWLTGWFLRDLVRQAPTEADRPKELTRQAIWQYTWPTVISTFLLLLAMNIDVIAVKRFFSPEAAGQYIAVSTVAKIIFYITGPISNVMFPLITEQQTRGEKHYHTLAFSLLFTLVGSLILLGIYYLFQERIVTILYGAQYRALAHLLPQAGWLIVFLAVVNLLVNYFMSIKTFKFTAYFATVMIIEILAIWRSHQSISDVIHILQGGMVLLLMVMLVNYALMKRTQLLAIFRRGNG